MGPRIRRHHARLERALVPCMLAALPAAIYACSTHDASSGARTSDAPSSPAPTSPNASATSTALPSSSGSSSSGASTSSSSSGGSSGLPDDAGAPIDAGDLDSDGGDVDLGSPACAPVSARVVSDAGDCAEYKLLPCGAPKSFVSWSDQCNFSLNDCNTVCKRMGRACHLYEDSCSDGGIPKRANLIVECAICPGSVGRRPEGFVPGAARPHADEPLVASYFGELARLEHASIAAFERLASELSAHGAPSELVASAHAARRDEVRHTSAMRRLALRAGGDAARTHEDCDATPRTTRSLEEIAIENAVEGCVRETLGAFVAVWQAEHAPDRTVARTFRTVARDEMRHAALAWAVDAWAQERLSPQARVTVERARDAAVEELLRESERTTPQELAAAGVPESAVQRAMVAALTASLWS